MRNMLARFWNDEGGTVIGSEWVFVATVLVLGTITGLVAVRQATLAELIDAAESLPARETTTPSPDGR
jgi:hypothetical protein